MEHIIYNEGLYIDDKSLTAIQHMYNSDIRSMVNFIQLNQNIFLHKDIFLY